MKKLFTLALMLLTVYSASAFEIPVTKDSTKQDKYKFYIKGRVDAYAFMDTHATTGSANGLLYAGVAKPNFEPGTLNDLNNDPRLRFAIGATRIGAGGSVQFNKKNSVDAFVEIDFRNQDPNAAMIGVRLRHAYARLNLGKSSILFGQTSHLAMFEEIAPALVQFGAGYPFNPLSRPVQFRFTQNFSKTMHFDVALAMTDGAEYVAQSYAMTPDLSARFVIGSPKRHTLSLVAGVKSIEPKLASVSNKNARMTAIYGGVAGKVTAEESVSVSGSVFYGSDLSTIGMIGGYAATSDLSGYSAMNTLSAWLDVATVRYNGFAFGAFVGFQQNLGTLKEIDKASVTALGSEAGVDKYWMVGPRMWYFYEMMSFGLEYMYGEAEWMEDFNNRYQSNGTFPPVSNNRVTLLARFTF